MNDMEKHERIEQTDSFFPQMSEDSVQPGGQNAASLSASAADAEEHLENEVASAEETRMAAVMAYVPFLCFIPLLNMRHNKDAVFHARQGVVLFMIELLAVLFLIDGLSDFIFRAVLVVAAGFSAAGIYFALQGRKYRLPFISDVADKAKL